jgi:hypothetical protein
MKGREKNGMWGIFPSPFIVFFLGQGKWRMKWMNDRSSRPRVTLWYHYQALKMKPSGCVLNEFGIFINMPNRNNKTVMGTPLDGCVALDLPLYTTLTHTYRNCLSFYWITPCVIGISTCREALKRAAPLILPSFSFRCFDISDEKEIFQLIGMEYLEPHERSAGSQHWEQSKESVDSGSDIECTFTDD